MHVNHGIFDEISCHLVTVSRVKLNVCYSFSNYVIVRVNYVRTELCTFLHTTSGFVSPVTDGLHSRGEDSRTNVVHATSSGLITTPVKLAHSHTPQVVWNFTAMVMLEVELSRGEIHTLRRRCKLYFEYTELDLLKILFPSATRRCQGHVPQ